MGPEVLVVMRDVTAQHAALDALERDREVFWSGPVVALVWGLEAGLPVVYASPNVFTLLGYRSVEFTAPDFRMHSLIHPDDHVRVQQEVAAFSLARTTRYEQRYRLRHRNGHWVHVFDATRVRYHESGRLLDKRGYLLDQTAEAKARSEAAQLLQALDQSPDSVVITDLAGNTEYVNRAYSAMTGYTLEEVRGRNQRLLASGKTPRHRYTELWNALSSGQSWEGEFINRKKSGQEFAEWLKVAVVRDRDGRPTHYLALKQDLSVHRATEARVVQLSRFDPLTGLANRAHLLEALEAACGEGAAVDQSCALVVVNISRFKRINDAQGHEAGDQVLQAVANSLSAPLNNQELAARLGADEFGLLLRAAEGDVTRRVLALLSGVRSRLAAGVSVNGQNMALDLFTAATLFPEGPSDAPAAVMLRAENALNAARESGHAEVRFFDAVMGDVARQRFALEQDLKQGIPRNELRVYLQSQVHADGRLAGCEALVRWQHPSRGLLAPGVFIGLAEESDLIVTLEQWVFARVFELVASQEALGAPLHCSINLSARHFRQPGFVPWIRGLLERTGAPAERLTLEITESIALDAMEDVVSRMLVLRRMGLHFSLDDFGTGFSSLSYLRRLPISELKIDKSFVNDVPAEPDAVALVRTILNVAHSLQLRVVAEGVETLAQAQFLSDASASEARLQGYLYSRPLPAAEWLALQAASAADRSAQLPLPV
jgi:diguanylate cyclase (GGDEF)-like protein/PAS domain S-box-containing protein